MERFTWMQINGHLVLSQDFSDLKHVELMKMMSESHDLIKHKGVTDLIVITNVKNVWFDHQVAKHFEIMCEVNKKYIAESAMYNVGSIQKAAIESIANLTDRKFTLFEEEEDVKKWLRHIE